MRAAPKIARRVEAPLAPVALLLALLGWMKEDGYGPDHPWCMSIAETMSAHEDRAASESNRANHPPVINDPAAGRAPLALADAAARVELIRQAACEISAIGGLIADAVGEVDECGESKIHDRVLRTLNRRLVELGDAQLACLDECDDPKCIEADVFPSSCRRVDGHSRDGTCAPGGRDGNAGSLMP